MDTVSIPAQVLTFVTFGPRIFGKKILQGSDHISLQNFTQMQQPWQFVGVVIELAIRGSCAIVSVLIWS